MMKSKRMTRKINPYYFSLSEMSKTTIIRKITKLLPKIPKKTLVKLYYNMVKAELPRLRIIGQNTLPKRKTKRKFSRKQLAAQRLFAKRARAGTLRKRRRR